MAGTTGQLNQTADFKLPNVSSCHHPPDGSRKCLHQTCCQNSSDTFQRTLADSSKTTKSFTKSKDRRSRLFTMDNNEAPREVNTKETPVLRVGDKALYRAPAMEEMHEVEIVSVDHTLQPPSYVIRLDAREQECESGRLTLISEARANSRSVCCSSNNQIPHTKRARSWNLPGPFELFKHLLLADYQKGQEGDNDWNSYHFIDQEPQLVSSLAGLAPGTCIS
eukprot:1802605-Rhodomonas_salina.1